MKKRHLIEPVPTQAITYNGCPPELPLPYAWKESKQFEPSPVRYFRLRLLGPNAPLRVYANEPKGATFVVVTAALGAWRVSGWIQGSDALRAEWRISKGWFEVPQAYLRPMSELDEPAEAESLFDAVEGSP